MLLNVNNSRIKMLVFFFFLFIVQWPFKFNRFSWNFLKGNRNEIWNSGKKSRIETILVVIVPKAFEKVAYFVRSNRHFYVFIIYTLLSYIQRSWDICLKVLKTKLALCGIAWHIGIFQNTYSYVLKLSSLISVTDQIFKIWLATKMRFLL